MSQVGCAAIGAAGALSIIHGCFRGDDLAHPSVLGLARSDVDPLADEDRSVELSNYQCCDPWEVALADLSLQMALIGRFVHSEDKDM